MPSVLFIPDRFMDYRMWGEVPDLIRDRASVVHLDQCMHIPWPAPDEGFLDAVRGLAPREGFDVVAAAGQAARFGFAIASAGLSAGLMFFYPTPDRHLDEVTAAAPDPDPAEYVDPFLPLVNALEEEDAALRRDILIQVVRDTAGPGADPVELDRVLAMTRDHAEEIFASLAAAAEPADPHGEQGGPPWLRQPWLDQLPDLGVPVMAVIAPQVSTLGDVIARRAADAEIVIAEPRLTPVPNPATSVAALLRMLSRVR
jgi:hypothetical protein